MPLARKPRTKKLYTRRLLLCAFQADHYDNKFQSCLTLSLRELVLLNGSSPASVVRCFPLLLYEIP